jgi:choline dehydrogenase-like flavoprotein
MLFDAAVDRSAAERRFDVCVIGAGPAGITLARRLAAAGADVALMEGGGYDISIESQEIYEGENVGLDYFPLDTARLRFFGGTSNHWGGWCRELDAIDFVAKPHHPLSGWPIGKIDLDPYVPEADVILDLPPEAAPPPSVLPQPEGNFFRTEFRFSPPTRFRDKYWNEIGASERIRCFVNANLVDLRLSNDLDTVSNGVFRSYAADDPGFTVAAKAYVLCTGGIENPRLLLNFRSQEPDGIGNRFDLVGRYFAEHPHVAVADVLLENPIAQREFYAVTEEFIYANGLQNCAVHLATKVSEPVPDLLTAAKRSVRCEVPFIDRLAQQVLGTRGRCASPALASWWNGEPQPEAMIRVDHEQALNPDSRVSLADTRDALGLQKTVLNWQLDELDFHTMRTVTIAFGRHLAAHGIGRARLRDWLVAHPPYFPKVGDDEVAGWHHMGTTRMAEDPRHGVVDRDCRVHGLSNLYIGGSSVFSTCGYSNPTYTIVQLSLRLGDHLATRVGSL